MDRVLIIDDDVELCQLLAARMSDEGFEIEAVHNGAGGLERALSREHSLVVLDLMLPGMGGLDVLRRVRERSPIPVLILTARGEDVDRILGLEIGADDYVTKPYSPRELAARIRAVLRRQSSDAPETSAPTLAAGPVRMDVERHVVTVDGSSVQLPLKEFELLELLLRNAGRVLTRGQLIDRVWGADYVGDTKTLDVHVKRLRSKVEPEPSAPRYIVTVRGLGYKFEP
jgi:two-component system, OmpR family, response regulator RegX3